MRGRWLSFFAFVLLWVATVASAGAESLAKSRVGAFDFVEQGRVGVDRHLTAEEHSGNRQAYDEVASGSPLATRAGGVLTRVCFAGGTLVLTSDGLKAIEEIELGDYVWSRDDETGEESWKPVVEIYATPDRELLDVVFENEDGEAQELRVTSEHPLWSLDDDGWNEVGQLELGERVHSLEGPLLLVAVSAVSTVQTVYNVEVADSNTYFVGEAGIWAHNICLKRLLDRLSKTGLKPTQQASKMDIAKVGRYAAEMKAGNWRWGGMDKIIVDKNGAIVSGHHRVMAAAESGVAIPESGIFRMTMETIRPVYEWGQVLIP